MAEKRAQKLVGRLFAPSRDWRAENTTARSFGGKTSAALSAKSIANHGRPRPLKDLRRNGFYPGESHFSKLLECFLANTKVPEIRLRTLLVCLPAIALSVAHSTISLADLVKASHGVNEIRLSNGKQLIFTKGLVDNFTSHSKYIYSFYVKEGDIWYIVPLNKEHRRYAIESISGADCVVKDLDVSVDGGAVELIVSEREFTQSYGEENKVTFTFYKLTRNESGIPGLPRYSFIPYKAKISKSRYCDVHEALSRELGITTKPN